MRNLISIFYLSLTSLAFASAAQASCNIYTPSRAYMGNMITTGSAYVGVPPGADDGTPYAGDIRGGVVSLGETSRRTVGSVKGNQLMDLSGKVVATVNGTRVTDPSGQLIAITENPYDNSGLCAPEVALAGVGIFLIFN